MKCTRTKPQTEWVNMGKRARHMNLDRDKFAADIIADSIRALFVEGYDAEDRRLAKKAIAKGSN